MIQILKVKFTIGAAYANSVNFERYFVLERNFGWGFTRANGWFLAIRENLRHTYARGLCSRCFFMHLQRNVFLQAYSMMRTLEINAKLGTNWNCPFGWRTKKGNLLNTNIFISRVVGIWNSFWLGMSFSRLRRNEDWDDCGNSPLHRDSMLNAFEVTVRTYNMINICSLDNNSEKMLRKQLQIWDIHGFPNRYPFLMALQLSGGVDNSSEVSYWHFEVWK